MNEVYHIRLTTGEDLISEVIWPENIPANEPHVILVQPMKIICLPSGKTGFVTLSLMQWVFTKISSAQEFNIYSRDILTMSKPNENLVEYYKETIEYFRRKSKPTNDIEQYLDDLLEKEIRAVEDSDKVVEEGELTPELEDLISEFFNSYSSNNKGTLH